MASVHLRRYAADGSDRLSGACWAVRSVYSAQWVDLVKGMIHPSLRVWNAEARVWIVSDSERSVLRGLIDQVYGSAEVCSVCASGKPCWVWREIDETLSGCGYTGASTVDAGRPPPPPKQKPWWEQPKNQRRERRQTDESWSPPPPRASRHGAPMDLDEAARLLGVSHVADESAVKRAFARACLAAHPDAGGSDEQMKLLLRARDAFAVAHALRKAGARV